MANFAAIYSSNEKNLQHSGRSANIDAMTSSPALNCQKDVAQAYVGTKAGSGLVSVASWANGGTKHEMFCGTLFEKVIVIPRTKALGFVLSTQTFSLEVWNAYQNSTRNLTSISISGGGGVAISGGLGSSAAFGPGQSSVYTATVSQDGPANLVNVVTFNFAGVTGADLSISGTRITVFSIEIDWSEGFKETLEYKTDIMPSINGAEQRVQLRTLPRYGASFRAVTLEPKDSSHLDALLLGWQHRVFGVPWWMDASLLTTQANPGDTVIQVDTTSRPAFASGGLVMLWKDQHAWEALSVVSVAAGAVTLVSPVQGTFPLRTVVVPLKKGRMAEVVDLEAPANWASVVSASFECEVL